MAAVALFGAMIFVNGQSDGVKFTEFKFFSTKGEFDWDKVVYGTTFEKDKLFELQVLVEFENPGEKAFNAEVKIYLDGKLIKTEPYKDLTKSGGFNSGVGGDSGTAGKVVAGVYKAELWYQGKVVKTAEATVTGVKTTEVSEWKRPSPEKWTTMSDVKLTMGFAKGWDTHEQKDAMAGVSPDGKIRVTAYVSDFPTVKETLANLKRTFDSWCDGLKLSDPEYSRETNGLKVLSTGGTAKLKDGGQDIDVAVDVIEVKGKIVILAIYGFHDAMQENFGDIVMTQESYKRAE